MEQNTFFFLILPLLLHLGAEGAPVAPVLPSGHGHGLASASLFLSWIKVMANYWKYVSTYRTMTRVLEDDQNADYVEIGKIEKIPPLLRFGKRDDKILEPPLNKLWISL